MAAGVDYSDQERLEQVQTALQLLADSKNCYRDEFTFVNSAFQDYVYFDRKAVDLTALLGLRPNPKLIKFTSPACREKTTWR